MTDVERAKLKSLAITLYSRLHDLPPSALVSPLYTIYDDLIAMAETPSGAKHLWFLGCGRFEDRPFEEVVYLGGHSLPRQTGEDKIGAIKLVRGLTSLGLAEAKLCVERAPIDLGIYASNHPCARLLMEQHNCEWRNE